MPPDQDMRHFGRHKYIHGLSMGASACTLCATFVWTSCQSFQAQPYIEEAKPLSTAAAPDSSKTSPSPLSVLSAWQKLFKILLLGATSKCQVFTITLPLLLLLQFYLILMGFFLPPTAECIKQSQAHRRITHGYAKGIRKLYMCIHVPN